MAELEPSTSGARRAALPDLETLALFNIAMAKARLGRRRRCRRCRCFRRCSPPPPSLPALGPACSRRRRAPCDLRSWWRLMCLDSPASSSGLKGSALSLLLCERAGGGGACVCTHIAALLLLHTHDPPGDGGSGPAARHGARRRARRAGGQGGGRLLRDRAPRRRRRRAADDHPRVVRARPGEGLLRSVGRRGPEGQRLEEEGGSHPSVARRRLPPPLSPLRRSDWRASNIWWIQSVYVAPPHRLQGLYKALYAHVRREAAATGACGLRLYADDSNAIAQESYKKLGMTSHYRVFEDMFTAY